MVIDDLVHLTQRDPVKGQREPSKRHGRGKRWRLRWSDPEAGEKREELFERKTSLNAPVNALLQEATHGS